MRRSWGAPAILALLVVLTPLKSTGQELGPPPVWPESWVGSELQAREAETGPLQPLGTSLEAINPGNREAARLFYTTHYLAPDSPIAWTGNRAACDAGSTASAFRDAVLLRLNYFRAMAGVPASVTFSDTYNGKDQKAALMMSANNQLNHYPPATWTCYSADGAEAAGKSNLALGAYGRSAIDLYMKDPGSGNGFAGHRRWILFPTTQVMGTGDILSSGSSAAQALWVIDATSWGPRPATREAFVAWPPPGFVPYQVVYPRWSFSHPQADFASATVTMTQAGAGVPVVLEAVATGYGDNTVVWILNGMSNSQSWPAPSSDTTYRVTINNAMVSGSPRSFTYDVTVFDPATIIPTPAKVGVFRPSSGIFYLDTNGNRAWDGCGTDGCVSWGGDPSDKVVLGDWNASGTTKVGVYRAATGTWYLDTNGNGTWDGCGGDACISWGGDASDVPVVGDWNHSGTTKIGVYRKTTGTWYLDANGNGTWDGCGTDKCVSWGGDPADMPVVGDWNAGGSTKIGVSRNGIWYLDYNGNGIWDGCGTDKCVSWGGDPSDQPVLGDWNGSGSTKIGVYRNGAWYLDTNGNGLWDGCGTDACITWGGDPTDKPVLGDWNGNGSSKIGVYRASSGVWYFDTNGNGTWDGCGTDGCISWGGAPGDQPIVGKW